MNDLSTITLTKGQAEALDLMNKWWKSKNNQLFFTVSGRAGTGKTTLVNRFVNNNNLGMNNCCVAAPTHKAKNVIAQVTDLQAFTLQKLLGIGLNVDITEFHPHNPAFAAVNDPMISKFKLVILDEASMVNEELYFYLLELCKDYKIKVVFIGDHRQLNPVNEPVSKVFTSNDVVELKEIVRQKADNPIIQLLDNVIKDIDNGTQTYLNVLRQNKNNINSKGEGYIVYNDIKEFRDTLVPAFGKGGNIKLLAYHNDVVVKWNEIIEKGLVGAVYVVRKGMVVTGYKTVSIKDGPSTEVIIENSADYIVESYSKPTVLFLDAFAKINVVRARLRMIGTTIVKDVSIVLRDSYLTFGKYELKKIEKAKIRRGKRAWQEYYDFRNHYILTEDIRMDIAGSVVKASTKDLALGHAITVHKSQGSTYQDTYIILSNILRDYDLAERNRLVNVALSRTKGVAHIFLEH